MSRKKSSNAAAVERDRKARQTPDPHEVLARCCGCQIEVTRKMFNTHRAIRIASDTWMCYLCEGGG